MRKRSRLSELLRSRAAAAKKRTNITIETHELLVLRSRRSLIHCWCAACAVEVDMLPAEQAAVVAGTSLRSLCREVEAGNLHYTETEDGLLLICLSSLLQQPKKT